MILDASMLDVPLMKGVVMLIGGVTASAISFQIGRVWEHHHTRKAIRRANLCRILAEERIEKAEREIEQIQSERTAMREVASEWNRILAKVQHGHRQGTEVRNVDATNTGLRLRH